ncbi:MAG: hypothetical protein B7Z22_04395 [Hyphomonas sp. 32-62-5]|nr:MAG: hypothetical protein B7Z22_04395 [Hyphomonas sp. 32-62-5]
MTRNRDLGPILAIAGAAIAVIAVIAGFIIIGGPGDARDRRLDEMTTGRLMDIFNVVQCAYNGTSAAPPTVEAAANAQGRIAKDEPLQPCNFGMPPERLAALPGRTPPNPGDISYEANAPSRVTLCANYRRPNEGEFCNGVCIRNSRTSIFSAAHPAGIHCYDLELTQSQVVQQ